MKAVQASLVEKVRGQTRGEIADIVLNHQEDDCSEGDNSLVNFVRKIVQSDMVSFWLMKKDGEVEKDTVVSNDVIGRVSKEVAWSKRLMEPIADFVREQVYHQI